MTDLRKAAEMALESLDWYVQEDDVIESMDGNEPWVEGKRRAENAIQALRQALAQGVVQEIKLYDDGLKTKHEWVGLTDDEIDHIWGITKPDYEDLFDFPRAIEAKLRAKNGF